MTPVPKRQHPEEDDLVLQHRATVVACLDASMSAFATSDQQEELLIGLVAHLSERSHTILLARRRAAVKVAPVLNSSL